MRPGDQVRINRATWDVQVTAMRTDPFRYRRVGVIVEDDRSLPKVYKVSFLAGSREWLGWIHEDFLVPDMLLIVEMP